MGIVKLTQKMARLCSKERTIESFGLSRAPVFLLFPPFSFPQGEGLWERFFINLTMPYPMLARNLLYTGVTRGKQRVVVIGQPRAVAIAVRNGRATQRLTNLATRLREGASGWNTGVVVR